jgi:hypothetical protein
MVNHKHASNEYISIKANQGEFQGSLSAEWKIETHFATSCVLLATEDGLLVTEDGDKIQLGENFVMSTTTVVLSQYEPGSA